MKSLCQFALLFFFSGSISQALAQQYRPEDTAYYDANYNAVPDSSGAVYFRLPAVPENERWRVQYFFLPGGEPAFTGVYQAVKEDGGWSIEPVVAIKDGPFTFYTKGGKVASEGTYTRDLETGLWRYYRRGRLRESRLYLDDKRIDSVFHGNGQVAAAGPKSRLANTNLYIRNGPFMFFHPNGRLFGRLPYIRGQLAGQLTIFDSTGVLIVEGNFMDAFEEGLWKYYQEGTGRLIREVMFSKGKRSGIYREFDPDSGTCIVSGNYDSEGQCTGNWNFFAADGRKIGEVKYRNNRGKAVYLDPATQATLARGEMEGPNHEGTWSYYYRETGKRYKVLQYEKGKLHGNQVFYDTLGYPVLQLPMFHGVEFGTMIMNHPYSEKVWIETELLTGKYHGKQRVYYRTGTLKREATYFAGKLKMEKCINLAGEEEPCVPFYIPASCTEDLSDYIGRNLQYPPVARSKGLQGKVKLGFFVGETGKVSDISVIEGFDKECEEEAVRLISSMPPWRPVQLDGIPVISYEKATVVFWLPELDEAEMLQDRDKAAEESHSAGN